ncbi:minor capsid protein [Amorphus orientalis]|uniref:SPP1 gp7 family putative phage head morphogenesis protein n=1 Tax=Amorphus orientalis TaxID=649198 RepID=A0AAE3VP11_9HYPH|nr:minor capsid protein [Amorphus orientalis]MDQ0315500.1 SPP1 gp7 family putative phage head morphogenesis protein [Amorphus orientalis]
MAAIRFDPRAAGRSVPATKRADRSSKRARFAARLNADARANGRMLLSTLRALDLSPRDLPDITEPRAEALAEWDRRAPLLLGDPQGGAERRPAALQVLEDDIALRFTSRINAERQQALGIDRYVWRSRDDALVRPGHAVRDDRVFFWDEPPEGGHPGEAYNCRCVAEPVLADEPEWRPTIDGSYGRAIDRAILEGAFDAAIDFASDFLPSVDDLWALLDALAELAEVGADAAELAALVVRDALVGLDDGEVARRDALLGAAGAWARGLSRALRDAPALAEGLVAYVGALEARPAELDRAYRRGLATRADVEEAHRERSYVRTSAALYGLATALSARTAAKGLTTRLMRRLGRRTDLGDEAVGASLLARARRARAVSPHADWRRIDNPGIQWGRGIRQQGHPWEQHLATRGDLGEWIAERAPNFKTFDFFDESKGLATSAKTLDTRALSYVRQPRRIFVAMKGYIDKAYAFDRHRVGRYEIRVAQIESITLKLAVPVGTSHEQIKEINRARAYAESLGIEMEVTFVR